MADLRDLYQEVILEHSKAPRNYRELPNANHKAEGFNPLCGDRVRIELALAADGSVRAARFRGDLCMIAQAASSLLTELVIGAELDQIADFPPSKLLDALHAEIRPARMNCALLPLTATPDPKLAHGTRHRAALGLSEESDALIVVVSEENGSIALAIEGVLHEHLDLDALAALIKERS